MTSSTSNTYILIVDEKFRINSNKKTKKSLKDIIDQIAHIQFIQLMDRIELDKITVI